MPIMVIVMRRLAAFFSAPESGPLILATVLTAGAGSVLGLAWMPPAAAVALVFLALSAGGDDDDGPQHPVLA